MLEVIFLLPLLHKLYFIFTVQLLATSTMISRCVRAVDFKKAASYTPPTDIDDLSTLSSGLWLVLGKTSPWSDESFPPQPSTSLKQIPEEKAFYYIPETKLVFPHPTGNITTSRGAYLKVDSLNPSSLAEASVTTVLVEPSVPAASLEDGINYRMAGLCSNLSFSSLPLDAAIGSNVAVPKLQVNSYTLLWAAAFKKFNKLDADALSFQIFVDF